MTVDARRRERTATVLGVCIGLIGLAIAAWTLRALQTPERGPVMAQTVVLSALCFLAAGIARAGKGTVAGVLLSAIPTVGS
ncbi:MAG: hypothetical protein ACO1OB_18190, partial [Archangium sp.]